MQSPYQFVDYSLPLHMKEDKLWKHVVIDIDGCWLYQRAINDKGYGYQSWNGLPKGAHVIAYIIANNKALSSWDYVAHKCDKRACCKPICLFRTNNKGNSLDALRKGRTTQGEKDGQAKLTEIQVREIIAKSKTGWYTDTMLGAEYGVNRSAINRIKHGKRWGHINDTSQHA